MHDPLEQRPARVYRRPLSHPVITPPPPVYQPVASGATEQLVPDVHIRRQVPFDVALIALLAPVIAVLGLQQPFKLFLFSGLTQAVGFLSLGAGLLILLAVIALLALVTIVGEFAFCISAWRLHPWAWMIGVVSQILFLATDLLMIGIFGEGAFSDSLDWIYGIVAGGILLYLFTPRMRRLFGLTGTKAPVLRP